MQMVNLFCFGDNFFPLKRATIPDIFFSISAACANEESSVFNWNLGSLSCNWSKQ